MGLSELVSVVGIIGGAGSVIATLGGVFYLRGKLDNTLTALGERVSHIEETIGNGEIERGRQIERNALLQKTIADVEKVRGVAYATSNGLAHHEAECQRAYNRTATALDEIKRSIENLHGQLANVAAGRINRIYEVKDQAG